MQVGSSGHSANATLAGAVITLLGYLPLLVNEGSAPAPGEQNLQQRSPKSKQSRSPRFHGTGSRLPDMSTMEEGQSGTEIAESGMSNFKSYSNPYAVAEDSGMEYIQPALMPHVCFKIAHVVWYFSNHEISCGIRISTMQCYVDRFMTQDVLIARGGVTLRRLRGNVEPTHGMQL